MQSVTEHLNKIETALDQMRLGIQTKDWELVDKLNDDIVSFASQISGDVSTLAAGQLTQCRKILQAHAELFKEVEVEKSALVDQIRQLKKSAKARAILNNM